MPSEFILAVGGIGARKNLDRIRKACNGMNLVIAGVDIHVPDEEINLLYSSCEVLLYTPLYEGFGLPILEAFASGTPVVTSNTSSMPEVGGGAAIYADPFNKDDLKRKVNSILNDSKLKKELIQKGLERAKQFTWEKTSEKTIALYKKVLSK